MQRFVASMRCKERLAKAIHANLPLQVVQLITNPDWKGGPLVVLEGNCVRPSAATVASNYAWLLPMVRDSPQRAGAANIVCVRLFDM